MLTAKQWAGQSLARYTNRILDCASDSHTGPRNARTFGTMHKWESFSTDVINFHEALDGNKTMYRPVDLDAIDLELLPVQYVESYTSYADIRGLLMTAVLIPVSQVAANLGCRLTYTGNGSGRSASFSDLLIKIKQVSSLDDVAKLIMAVIEIKPPWDFDLPHDLHLVDALDTSHADTVIEAMQEALGDAVRNECPFMIITTGKVTHFIKRSLVDPANTDLWVSPPVPSDNSSGVPALAAWLYLLFEADKELTADGSKRLGWPQSQVPGTAEKGYRLMLNSKVVGLDAGLFKGHSLADEHHQPTQMCSSSPGHGKHPNHDHAEPANAASLAAGTDNSSSSSSGGINSNQSSDYSSNSSIGHVVGAPQSAADNTPAAAAAVDVFDANAWAERSISAAKTGLSGTAHAVAAVDELPFLPMTTYSCSAACMGWSYTKAVYKGMVLGKYDAICKLYNSRDDLALEQFVREATAYVALAEQLGSSIIPLLGLGRQPHTGDPMLVLAAGQKLPDVLSQEQRMSAEAALQSIHAAGWLHGHVESRNMLLFGSSVVMWNLQHSTPSSDAEAFAEELMCCREVLAHTDANERSDY